MQLGARGRQARSTAVTVVLALVATLLSVTAVVVPAPDAHAATVNIGTIQGQMADHRGVDGGTGGSNCITYAPPGTPTSSALVSSPSEAMTGHGTQTSGRCPPALSTSTQSVVGFRPSATTSASDGASFLIGRMVHYNNPVYSSDRYFTGKINTVLGGFTAPNTLSFPWTLDETPNVPSDVDDTIVFDSQISTVTLTQGGLSFKLVVLGFVPVATGASCPATPAGTPVNKFTTKERAQTHACLYASLQQVRSLTVVKHVEDAPPGTPPFGFTSTSGWAGSPWANAAWTLGSGASKKEPLTSGESVTVTETDPNDDRWALTGLTCKQYAADGTTLVDVPGVTVNVSARQAVLSNVPPPLSASKPDITCTFTNRYTPKATLTLVKQVESGSATPSQWTLTATGSAAPPPAGTVISGPSGSPAVTGQRVPAGTYTLTEVGTGSAETGYVQVEDWVCRTASGASVPVTNGTVTLPDRRQGDSGANVTCTVANRFATGSLRISKTVDDPQGGWTGGPGQQFSGSYDCGPGFTGRFTTLTTAAAVTISNIRAGRTCTVTEDPPSGGLANASYAWGPPTVSGQPATITDGGTAQVTITNRVVANTGALTVRKVVDGPGGYTGGTQRIFPVAYECTLAGGPTTSGTLDVTLAQPATRTGIPTGSVCTLTETLTASPGDFADPSFVWGTPSITPQSVTVGAATTVETTVTNTYRRELGSLVVAKVVEGEGFTGGSAPHFTVSYDCGAGFRGERTVAAGASTTIPDLPARLACTVQEAAPDPGLLAPGYAWGTSTWSPDSSATIPANGSATLTVTNPTVPVFGQVSVTKEIAGATEGVTASATFSIRVACGARFDETFTVPPGGTATTPNLPVGTACAVTEATPSGGLVDSSYAWGPPPGPQQVTVRESGQVVPVTLTNTVVRVRGPLRIEKAPISGGPVVDPARRFAIDYTCRYGEDAPVTGSVSLAAGTAQTVPDLLLGSLCTVTERPQTLEAPPSATDPSWVWLPPTYAPEQNVVVESPTTPAAVTVTNRIRQVTGSFVLSKTVSGLGQRVGYTRGALFTFEVTCSNGLQETVTLADGAHWAAPDLPASTSCTVTETGKPPPGPGFGWEPVRFTLDGEPAGADASVTFAIPGDAGVEVVAENPLTPRFGSVRVTKTVTGETEGLAPSAPPFTVTLTCGPGRTYTVEVPAGGSSTQTGIPAESECTAVESAPEGGLVDASYAWGPPAYIPADATVTVTEGQTATVGVENPIVRVTAPVRLVKTFAGPQDVVDPGRTYPVTWSCTYRGTQVAGGRVDIVAGPAGVVVADAVPLTSACTATEGDLGPPSPDPAYRWEEPVITGATVTSEGPNTVTVANTLVRDSGTVLVRKRVTGETSGYVGTGEDFTLHGSCRVPGHPEIPTRYANGTIADGGEVAITASIGWTCSGYEDTPSQALLRDASYAWGPAVLDPPGEFVLTRESPTRVFTAENPVVRVRDAFTIEKAVVDPAGVVDPGATFTGTYSCRYGGDAPVTGRWTLTPATGTKVTVPGMLLTSVCSVAEDDPGTTGLPDGSWTWGTPAVSPPVTVIPGGTATVTATNTAERLYGGLALTKTLVDPDGGVRPEASFEGVWECTLGDTTYSDRFAVGAGATVTFFSPADQRVPATATCEVTEDTPDPADLLDASFAFAEPVVDPPDTVLVAGQTANLGIRNTVERVYGDVTVQKALAGPGAPLVDPERTFTGTLTCRYRDEPPVVTTWSAKPPRPQLPDQPPPTVRAGLLVGSVCTATEDPPGATGQPVAGDPSYVWLDPLLSGPVTVAPPDAPTPQILVTNPTDRLFGTFTVTKAVTGATEGLADPEAPFQMTYVCRPGSGDPIGGALEVPATESRLAGPELQIPVDSVCTLTEPPDSMPALVDSAYAWDDPAFTVDGAPVPGPGRAVEFLIPGYQEDRPEPTVAVGVTNPVTRTPGAYTVTKSSDPASGTPVSPGATVTYSVTVDSTGTVPTHDVVVADDLSDVLPYAAVVAGSIRAPEGTSAQLDTAAARLVWTIGTVPNGQSLTLTYQVVVGTGAVNATIANLVTATGQDPPATCGAGDTSCSTTHTVPPTPTPPTPTPTPTPSPGGGGGGGSDSGGSSAAGSGGLGPQAPGSGLAGTGFPVATVLAWALTLLALGSTAVVLARRRPWRRPAPGEQA